MNNKQIEPKVGMGATICYVSDRHACTIVAVSASGHEVTVQRDTAVRTDKNGIGDCQVYEYSPNPEGCVEVYTLRKTGRYVRKGESLYGTSLFIGSRREYYDFCF